ncbi:MAG: hypothetical protein KF861_03965 [Planctomycetaceae bacterium]|nr:hypothetical protein [Planctomycetaceae bacterium]
MKRTGEMASGKVAKWQSGKVAVRSAMYHPGPLFAVRCSSFAETSPPRRGGAALIVVMALLGTLVFLGLLYYTFAVSESISAENFATAPPVEYPPVMFQDFALEQLIRGTRPSLENSALYGSNWALIPNMIGRPNFDEKLSLRNPDNAAGNQLADVNPFDGLGIGVFADASTAATLGAGQFVFDYGDDGSGTLLADQSNFLLNFSRAANPGPNPWSPPIAASSFHPDAGYTYPDVNSMFLAFDGYVRNPNDPTQIFRVIIPSFHRPQYFPGGRGVQNGTPNGSNPNGFSPVFTAPGTTQQVLRPHQFHVNADGSTRFINSVAFPTGRAALSGDTSRVILPFPFSVNINANGFVNQSGVWTNPVANATLEDANNPALNVYEFDVDNDGDGFRDSIWMDLGHSILDLPDGRQFVPIFSFKVIDADALLNVNAHGNMNGFLPRGSDGQPITQGALAADLVSSSNLGLSRSEINLGLGLTADPTGIPQIPHLTNFGGGAVDALQLSNLELLMLLMGRENWRDVGPPGTPTFVVDGRVEGRWGDDNLMRLFYTWFRNGGTGTLQVPAPGAYLFDDDDNSNSSLRPRGGAAFQDQDLYGVWVPPFVHPLDYGGTGGDAVVLNGGLYQRRTKPGSTALGVAANPSAWLDYTQSPWQHQAVPAAAPATGVLPYWSTNPIGALQLNQPLHDFLLDNAGEVTLDRRFSDPYADAVFPTSEMDGLHLSPADFARVNRKSRLRDLAIINFNFDKIDDSGKDIGREIRSRFTTDSWDRYDFGHGQSLGGTADRDWEFNEWTGASPYDSISAAAFPPEFGGGSVATGTASDPFRPEVRLLLKSDFGYNDHLNPNSGEPRYPRHRLNINRILSDWSSPPSGVADDARPAFDANENPLFRNLTPHGVFEATDPQLTGMANTHHNNVTAPPYPFETIDTNKEAREWWARYDRQRLARDIYTLLYTLGGPDSVGGTILNLTSAAYPDAAASDQYDYRPGEDFATSNGVNDLVEQMAQFAVNVVDALDRDDVITRFEYDINLSNGWETTPGGADLRVVNGVEAQQLTFSEVLWVETVELSNDDNITFWDDRDERQYLYIELRNSRPFDVVLGEETWQIARRNAADTDDVASVTFNNDANAAGNRNVVSAGRTFLIGCHDNTVTWANGIAPSDFYVETNAMTAGFELIIPNRRGNGNDPAAPTGTNDPSLQPATDLDLSFTHSTGDDDQTRFNLDSSGGNTIPPGWSTTGTLVDSSDGPNGNSTTEFTLVLRRRRNLNAGDRLDYSSTSTDEWADWVEVDRIEVNKRTFNSDTSSTPILENLSALQSTERQQPLTRQAPFEAVHAADPTTGISHTLGHPDFALNTRNNPQTNLDTQDRNRGNSNTPVDPDTGLPAFTVWQPHFDRDFSSIFELLAITLCRPEDLTLRLTDDNGRLSGYDSQPPGQPGILPSLAGSLIRSPDNSTLTDPDDDNRWYRLFEFLTVPDNEEGAVRERVAKLVRTPGKINLNTLRDEAVLAAILDDQHVKRFDAPLYPDEKLKVTKVTEDALQDDARNWYRELLLARDGIDPLNDSAGLQLLLPGVPGVPSDSGIGRVQFGAVPFRSQSYVAPDLSSIWPDGSNNNKTAHTLFRNHVLDDSTKFPTRQTDLDQLGLFEARPTTDLGTDAVDYHTRNRLLGKVANHTTTRSNVFAVWLTVGFFEAHQPNAADPRVVQIGAEMAGMPRQRSFFVVDRTRLEEAVEVDDRGTADPADDIITLNWRSFLLHRRTLAE